MCYNGILVRRLYPEVVSLQWSCGKSKLMEGQHKLRVILYFAGVLIAPLSTSANYTLYVIHRCNPTGGTKEYV